MSNGYTKKLVCLANSRKHSGRCVAGKEIIGGAVGQWIRPVSGRESSELKLTERWYGNGRQVDIFDVFLIAFTDVKRHAYQTENHTIDTSYYCSYQNTLKWQEAVLFIDRFSGPIWINGYSSAYGINNQVPLLLTPSLGESLKFIYVTDFSVVIEHEWPQYGNKRKLRGSFSYNGLLYKLDITDPAIELNYAGTPDGTYDLGEALICISLAEPYKGNAYKLIASVSLKP